MRRLRGLHPRRQGHLCAGQPQRDQRPEHPDHRQLQQRLRDDSRQPAEVRCAAAVLPRAEGRNRVGDAGYGAAQGRPARRRYRAAARRHLFADLLPRTRSGHHRVAAGLRRAHLRQPRDARYPDRVHPEPGRNRRLHRRGRHHRRLVRGVLRTAQGRGARRQIGARSRAAGVGPGAPHDPVGRHGVVPRSRGALLLHHRRGARLRVHPGPVDDPRPGRGLPVHPPARVAAVAFARVRLGALHRPGLVALRPGDRPGADAARASGAWRHVRLPSSSAKRRRDAGGFDEVDDPEPVERRARGRAGGGRRPSSPIHAEEADDAAERRRTTPEPGSAAERAAARRARLRGNPDEKGKN